MRFYQIQRASKFILIPPAILEYKAIVLTKEETIEKFKPMNLDWNLKNSHYTIFEGLNVFRDYRKEEVELKFLPSLNSFYNFGGVNPEKEKIIYSEHFKKTIDSFYLVVDQLDFTLLYKFNPFHLNMGIFNLIQENIK